MKHTGIFSKLTLPALLAALAMASAACSPTAAPVQESSSELDTSAAAPAATASAPEQAAQNDDSAASTTAPEVQFFGTIDAMSASAWVIDGQTVAVAADTQLKDAVAVGDSVKVTARVLADGSLEAREARLADDTLGAPGAQIEFAGTVEAMGPGEWTVAGKTVAIVAQTEIKDTIQAGDFVRVHALVAADRSLTAREIELADGTKPEVPGVEVEFRGTVEAMSAESWTVSGIAFSATSATEIEAGIQMGDFVKVHARRQSDGSLWAREIERERDQDRDRDRQSIEFTGTVEAMGADAWTIDGQLVAITAQTQIKGDIQVGDFVKVHAMVQDDGSLVAREIELDDHGQGNDDNGNDDNANGNANDNGNVNDNGGDDNGNDNGGNDNGNDDHGNDNGGNGNGND